MIDTIEKKLRSNPFPARKLIGEEEKTAVIALFDKCIKDGGAFDRYDDGIVEEYENQFAAYFEMKFAAAVSSGTGAIHTALAALKIEPFGEVISAPMTDPGAVMPILWMNCIPVFADTEPGMFNMSAASVEARVSEKTRAIIVGHIAGHPCDMDGIMEVARKHKIPVIEDVSQSHDAVYKSRKLGTIGDIGCFSLMSGKHHTAGGQGGMLITNNEELYWNAKRFADRGKPFNTTEKTNISLGLNYRMTSLEAVIGMVQLKKLAGIVANRRLVAEKVKEGIKGLKAFSLGRELPDTKSSYWFLIIKADESKLKVPMSEVMQALKEENVPGGIKYECLIHEQKWIKDRTVYGTTQFPWSSPEYGKSIIYEGTCPEARKSIDTHFVVMTTESWGEVDAADLVNILKKIEARFVV